MEATEARDEIAAYVAAHREELDRAQANMTRSWEWLGANRRSLAGDVDQWVAVYQGELAGLCASREGLRAQLKAKEIPLAEAVITLIGKRK